MKYRLLTKNIVNESYISYYCSKDEFGIWYPESISYKDINDFNIEKQINTKSIINIMNNKILLKLEVYKIIETDRNITLQDTIEINKRFWSIDKISYNAKLDMWDIFVDYDSIKHNSKYNIEIDKFYEKLLKYQDKIKNNELENDKKWWQFWKREV